jgi:hypothetical protein
MECLYNAKCNHKSFDGLMSENRQQFRFEIPNHSAYLLCEHLERLGHQAALD